MKNFTFLLVALGLLFSCQQNKTADGPPIKKGMIKLSVLYPNGEGKTFDMDYYQNKHMVLAKTLMGDSLKYLSIDKGVGGAKPDSIPYLAVGHLYFETMSSFQNSMGIAREKLVADIPNYTNIQPVLLISEVQE